MTIFRTKAEYLAWLWENGKLEHERQLIDEFLFLRKNGAEVSQRFDEAFKSISAKIFSEDRRPSRKPGRPNGKGISVEKQRQATREYLSQLRSGSTYETAVAAACRICSAGDRQTMRYVEKHKFWEKMQIDAADRRQEALVFAEGLRRMHLYTSRIEVHDSNGKILFYRVPRDDERLAKIPDGPWITVAVAREFLRIAEEAFSDYLKNLEMRIGGLYELVQKLKSDKKEKLEECGNIIAKEEIDYFKETHEHALMANMMLGEFLVRSTVLLSWSPQSRAMLGKNIQRMNAITDSLKSLDPLTADKNAP